MLDEIKLMQTELCVLVFLFDEIMSRSCEHVGGLMPRIPVSFSVCSRVVSFSSVLALRLATRWRSVTVFTSSSEDEVPTVTSG